jgi:Dolichyl-phosphate-mannose-protein mannosyltransferase/Tetratricopeptide repeat
MSAKEAAFETGNNSIILPDRTNKYAFPVLTVALFAAFAFQLWYHAVRASVTVDEPPHILAGYRHLQCGDYGINPEHPPMAKMLATIPLQFRAMNQPPWDCGSQMTSKPDSFTYGGRFLVENGVDSVVIPARLSIALLSLFLAAMAFLAAWTMFGRAEALVALALLAFEPSLIGHGSVVTTDMALSATAFAFIYALYRFCSKTSWFRFIVVGLALGLMLSAKHSAVFFVGISFALVIADAVLFRSEESRLPRQMLRRTAAFAAFFLIGFTVLWAFYGFRYYAIPSATGDSVSVADYIKENGRPEMAASVSAKATELVSRTHIFPESYTLGMADVIAWGARNTFIFDRAYPTGQWFYFPVALTVKSSIAFLLLLPLGFLYVFFNREKRREMLFLLFPPIVFFIIASSSSFTTGIRHVLPTYAFFIVASAAGAVWLCRKISFFKYILIALLVFHAVTAIRIAPNYQSFANDFWGGGDNTYHLFRDSSVETGQSAKLMNEYLARENINDCWFGGFVHPELIRAIQPCRPLPSNLRILVSREVIEPVPSVIEGTVLVSVNELPPRGGGEYAPIAQAEPVALIGGNILVYRGRFEIPVAAAMSRAYRSGQFLQSNRVEEALAEGQIAVELAARDARTHLALGLALLRAGRRDEARREFETTIELAPNNPIFRNAEVRARLEIEKL